MNFCKQCGSAMTKTTTMQGNIIFTCRCLLSYEAGADDTLMAEGTFDTNDAHKYNIFLEQAPLDQAANRVFADCPGCGLNFMTMIQVGDSLTTMYACDCGYIDTYENYIKETSKKLTRAEAKKEAK